MKYSKARAEVVMFDNSDVITTSCMNVQYDYKCKYGLFDYAPGGGVTILSEDGGSEWS